MPRAKSKGTAYNVGTKGVLSAKAKETAQYLKRQYELGDKRDEEQVVKIMAESFNDRYNFILYQGPKVAQLMDIYPILFDLKHFLPEFDRITKTKATENFYKNLSDYSSTILFCTTGLNPIKNVIKDMLNKAQTNERKEYVKSAGALLTLPSIVREDISMVVKFSSTSSASVFPMIVCPSSVESVLTGKPIFWLYIEGRKVFETKDFTEVMLLRMAAHYCFDIQYPRIFQNSTAVMETLLLNIKPDMGELDEFVEDRCNMLTLMHNRMPVC